jgi:hypothetical protein
MYSVAEKPLRLMKHAFHSGTLPSLSQALTSQFGVVAFPRVESVVSRVVLEHRTQADNVEWAAQLEVLLAYRQIDVLVDPHVPGKQAAVPVAAAETP